MKRKIELTAKQAADVSEIVAHGYHCYRQFLMHDGWSDDLSASDKRRYLARATMYRRVATLLYKKLNRAKIKT